MSLLPIYTYICVKSRDIEWNDRKPSNSVFLIYTSGSMNVANKLPLV